MGDRNETTLSAEPPRADAPPRISGAHGDQERPQDLEPAPGARAEEPVGLTTREAPERDPGPDAAGAGAPLATIKVRRDFLAAARARKWSAPGFLLQGRDRGDAAPPRVGFTCSKKVGNAVARNRAKRRLRALARMALAPRARQGWDYVLIGKAGVTAARAFPLLLGDLETALERVHRPARALREPRP